ncbi:MAG: glycosyltransferase family 4 protein [Flavobacteriales bacterium]|nr:glycosyltransferase family 4 protein [Flavobacteriales bacterium]
MKIAVNTRLLLPNRLEGIGWFTYETLKRITRDHPEHEFIFLFDRRFDPQFVFEKNVTPVVIGPQARHPWLYKIWFGWSVPRALKKHDADIFLSPDGYLSLHTEVPQLAVIHDLNFEHYPEDLPGIHGRFYRKYFPKYARKAKRIATVSEYSKADIASQYSIDPEKIDVVFNGVGDHFSPLAENEKEKTRRTLTKGSPYFVFVGSLHPRKNIHRLFEAFDRFKAKTGSDHKLVIVGEKFWWNNEIEEAFENMSFNTEVEFLGRLSGVQLNRVVASAEAMAFVPYFEGFGIPVLEAFQSETPLITSNVTSLPEVAGDAAILVDPFNVDEITHAMERIAHDPELRIALIEKGKQQVQKFTWERTADLLWQSIERILSDKN